MLTIGLMAILAWGGDTSGSHARARAASTRSAAGDSPASTPPGLASSSAGAGATSEPSAAATAPAAATGDPGLLPQTAVLPAPQSAALSARMATFWAAVTSGVTAEGEPAFFPEAAYEQVKAIADPRADWTNRLLGAYYLDIGAAHRLLGPDAGSAQLLAVNIYEGNTHWVRPGTCYNRIGYFEVPNSRVVYRVDGEIRSFGIASLISWRGQWYIVHLGSINPPAGVATVDDPAVGPGHPAPLYTC